MSRHTACLNLRIKGPVLTAGLDGAAFGIDDANLVAADRQTFILPESLVRGIVVHVLREMSEHMNSADPKTVASLASVREWLGSGSADGSFEPHRRRIRFDELALVHGGEGRQIVRIKLDPDTGSVQHGAMQVVASPLDYGETGTFEGGITFELSKSDAEIARDWILKALAFVPAVGALKSSGFGRVAGFDINALSAVAAGRAAPAPAASSFRYCLKLDRPFLVASEAISGNLFKGAIDIPGAVIKGALADQLQHAGKLTPAIANALDKLVFRHAKPSSSTTAPRPRAIPLSIYLCDDQMKDALVDCPIKAGINGAYVEFQTDWKPTNEIVGCAERRSARTFSPRYDIRTRTAVGPGGTADDAKLFTRMAVDPGDHVWIGEVERPGGIDDAALKKILDALSDGLSGFGKTRANASVEWLVARPRSPQAIATKGNARTWRIVLETDALLHGPDDENAPLSDHYRNYFARVLGGNVSEFEFYATQRWVGGYQARRFKSNSEPYFPQLLTVAGSVFQFSCDAACDEKLQDIAKFGLPLPPTVGEGHTFQFERAAFNPENGYGEVSIDARVLTLPVVEA